jgi:hypothetical protein
VFGVMRGLHRCSAGDGHADQSAVKALCAMVVSPEAAPIYVSGTKASMG